MGVVVRQWEQEKKNWWDEVEEERAIQGMESDADMAMLAVDEGRRYICHLCVGGALILQVSTVYKYIFS